MDAAAPADASGSAETVAMPTRHPLTEIGRDWRFFNHGAAFVYGGVDPSRDPAGLWAAANGKTLLREDFGTELFRELPGDWGRTVFAVRAEHFDALLMAICGQVVLDPAAGAVREIRYAARMIPCPIHAARTGNRRDAPRVPIAVAEVMGSRESWVAGMGMQPRYRKAPPDSICVGRAEKLYGGDGLGTFGARRNPAGDAFENRYVGGFGAPGGEFRESVVGRTGG